MERIEEIRKDSMERAKGTYHAVYSSGATVVFNRDSGLHVWSGHDNYVKKTDMIYYNTDPRCHRIYKQAKYKLGTVGYTEWMLISLCLYFGRYNPKTGDYIISKAHDEGKWDAK